MTAGVDVEILRALYGGPPAEFVTSRDALVKELRAAGDRDLAAEVKRLRRHSPVEWTLNRVSHARPDVTSTFADTAERLRDAQAAAIEGRSGGDIREAMAALRDRSSDVVAAASEIDRSVAPSEVGALLLELAGDERGTHQLREGILGSTALDDADPFAGLTPADVARTRRADGTNRAGAHPRPAQDADRAGVAEAGAAPAEHERREPGDGAAASRRAQRDEAKQAREEARQRREDLRRAERAARDAAVRERDARAALHDAERALAAARSELEDAAAERSAADAEVDRLR